VCGTELSEHPSSLTRRRVMILSAHARLRRRRRAPCLVKPRSEEGDLSIYLSINLPPLDRPCCYLPPYYTSTFAYP